MVVMWCRAFGALLGVRTPLQDWSSDHAGLCSRCVQQGDPQKTNDQTDEMKALDTTDDLPSDGR